MCVHRLKAEAANIYVRMYIIPLWYLLVAVEMFFL